MTLLPVGTHVVILASFGEIKARIQGHNHYLDGHKDYFLTVKPEDVPPGMRLKPCGDYYRMDAKNSQIIEIEGWR